MKLKSTNIDTDPYDENQWYWSNKLQIPVNLLKYRDFIVRYKHHRVFPKKVIVNACCHDQVYMLFKDKDIISIKEK